MARPVIVTRPLEEGRKLAATLTERGYDPILAPALEIVPVAFDPEPPAGPHALIVTSVNGADALARCRFQRSCVVWAVGTATADRARAAGFSDVRDARGSAEDLLALLVEGEADPLCTLVWLSGEDVKLDLVTALRKCDPERKAERRIAYAARPVAAWSADVNAALSGLPEAIVLVLSPRSAGHLIDLLASGPGLHHVKSWTAVCISASVAQALMAATAQVASTMAADTMAWGEVRVAESPNMDALLSTLARDGARVR